MANSGITAQVVYCDDVRLEATAKHILIGTYGDTCNMNIGPGPLAIAMWINIFGVEKGTHPIKIAARKHVGNQSTEVGSLDADMEVLDSDQSTVVTLPPLLFHVDSDCRLSVTLEIANGAPISPPELKIRALFAQSEPDQKN